MKKKIKTSIIVLTLFSINSVYAENSVGGKVIKSLAITAGVGVTSIVINEYMKNR